MVNGTSRMRASALVRKVGDLIRQHRSSPIEGLIKKLNQLLRGWANYHRHVVSSEAFNRVDTYVYEQLWRMIQRRHHAKSKDWLIRKYWTVSGLKHVFSVIVNYKKKKHLLQVVRTCSIGIKRLSKSRRTQIRTCPNMPDTSCAGGIRRIRVFLVRSQRDSFAP